MIEFDEYQERIARLDEQLSNLMDEEPDDFVWSIVLSAHLAGLIARQEDSDYSDSLLEQVIQDIRTRCKEWKFVREDH